MTIEVSRRAQKNPRRRRLKSEFAKELRREMTDAERKLWSLLRRKQIRGLRFRRQHPIGRYVADFFCPAARLVIELDGGQHSEATHRSYDEARTRWLESEGFHVLRIANLEFLKDREAALDWIWHAVETSGCVLSEREVVAGPLPRNAARFGPSPKERVK